MDNNKLELAMDTLNKWGATPKEIQNVLPSYPDDEQEERVYCILSILNFLKVHFDNPKNRTGFMAMKNHNSFFEGRSPLEVISTGSLDDLKEVEARVRNMGVW
ncbi:hypothetical protein [Photobacterium alginatilyticum]|uniref:Antitoxin Xre/MbcA/ParS-like toxin-binding domain-containing protein n=1 Tax=Photobacterium alginatilyticum TaxID=1775171 RepID=A0ABW9YLK0_9GAMM|nr:hypothetical protein [Photobacterium alginatilyticum]NBI54570.1 hypothetical protein [Photobacterium alginatilyticum]